MASLQSVRREASIGTWPLRVLSSSLFLLVFLSNHFLLVLSSPSSILQILIAAHLLFLTSFGLHYKYKPLLWSHCRKIKLSSRCKVDAENFKLSIVCNSMTINILSLCLLHVLIQTTNTTIHTIHIPTMHMHTATTNTHVTHTSHIVYTLYTHIYMLHTERAHTHTYAHCKTHMHAAHTHTLHT